MFRATMALLGAFGVVALGGCLGGAGALASCDPLSPETSICNLMNPEDIDLLPDQTWIIVSEMALDGGGSEEDADGADGSEEEPDRPSKSGRLSAIRVADLARRSLYPIEPAERMDAVKQDESAEAAGGVASRQAPTPGWGDERCPGEPDRAVFGPQGIDIGRGPDGRLALAVVNHGGREAVELFEILAGDAPSLAWRGCVVMPEGIVTNDVAFLPGGGFVVTNFMPAFEGTGLKAIWTMLKISFGARTGSVLIWTPSGLLEEIENSEGSAPNGIAVSADGKTIYVAEWGGKSIYRLRLRDGAPPLRDAVGLDHNPDNLSWMRDGRLLVAGQLGGVSAALSCGSVENAGCDIGYSVYVIDAIDGIDVLEAAGPEADESLSATKLFEGRGAASVALEVEDEIFVGFFVGDQIERVQAADLRTAH